MLMRFLNRNGENNIENEQLLRPRVASSIFIYSVKCNAGFVYCLIYYNFGAVYYWLIYKMIWIDESPQLHGVYELKPIYRQMNPFSMHRHLLETNVIYTLALGSTFNIWMQFGSIEFGSSLKIRFAFWFAIWYATHMLKLHYSPVQCASQIMGD